MKPTPEEAARIQAWFADTVMCNACNQRVPKVEVQWGLHDHLPVMD